jgi:hypothetical protein
MLALSGRAARALQLGVGDVDGGRCWEELVSVGALEAADLLELGARDNECNSQEGQRA